MTAADEAPLVLTAVMASDLLEIVEPWLRGFTKLSAERMAVYASQELVDSLKALAGGRTRVVVARSEEQERAEFEAWCRSMPSARQVLVNFARTPPTEPDLRRDANGRYWSGDAEVMWEALRAARAAAREKP